MASKRPQWDLYNFQLSEFNSGHALWEPSPVADSECIEPGDVGYIRTGCFHLLFSAGLPLGERRRGSDVPQTFQQLDVGKIVKRAPLAAGALCTKGVRETQMHSTPSESPIPTSSTSPSPPISFRLTGGQGAALLTKYSTYREDIQRTGTFEKYAKEHYDSWVTFACETGHGDVNPVLITGVDRTRNFAMMCYSNGDDDLKCEFTTSVPGVADWGTWHKTGLVYTNHGPQLRCPPSSVQATELASSGDGNARTVSDEYNQCVFIRYYTVRKRLGIPRIIKAAAGPHELGRGGYDGDGPPLEAHYDLEQESDSDSELDTASILFDDDSNDDGCTIVSADTESDVVMHNTTVDGRDDFDVIADYIFHNSDAHSVLLHHQDIALLRELGGSVDLPAHLFERRTQITIDENGVGMIVSQAGLSAGTSHDGITVIRCGITLPTATSPPQVLQDPEPEAEKHINKTGNVDPFTHHVFQYQNESRHHMNVHGCCDSYCGVLVPFAVNGTYNGDGKKIIRFYLDNSGTCGIRFSRVLRGDLEGLAEREELAKLNPPANSIRLKLDLSGYKVVDRKMNTPTGSFTVEKLARNVCKQVAAFVNGAQFNGWIQPEWIIGPGGIVVEQLVLVSIKRISAGYWVPCIRLVNGQDVT